MSIEQAARAMNEVDGAEVLEDIRTFIDRFCAFPSEHELVAATLWAAHAHMVEHFHTTPRLAVLSPEPESGKSRVLEVLELLSPEAMLSLNASPAAVFRVLAQKQVTLLFDEVDAIWSRKGKDDNHEDLRALINAGYRKGANIPRCVGPQHDVKHFPVFAAVALAGLGDLPDTIMTRSVIIRMRRRAPHEHVESFRTRMHEPEGHAVRDRLALWAENVAPEAGASWPEIPEGVTDRRAECWEPLLAVADQAGGDWPELARESCVALCAVAQDRRVSLGIRLLADLKTIFRDADALHTRTILERLSEPEANGLDADAPWAELHGKGLSVRGLASLLKRYQVSPQKVTIDGQSLQGYRREPLYDAWTRYLPSEGSEKAELAELPELQTPHSVPQIPEVPETRSLESDDPMPDLAEVTDRCRHVIQEQELDLDATEMAAWLHRQGDANWCREAGCRAWALKVAKAGYPE